MRKPPRPGANDADTRLWAEVSLARIRNHATPAIVTIAASNMAAASYTGVKALTRWALLVWSCCCTSLDGNGVGVGPILKSNGPDAISLAVGSGPRRSAHHFMAKTFATDAPIAKTRTAARSEGMRNPSRA